MAGLIVYMVNVVLHVINCVIDEWLVWLIFVVHVDMVAKTMWSIF